MASDDGEELTDSPVDDAVDDSAQEPAEDSVDDAGEEPAEDSVDDSANDTSDLPIWVPLAESDEDAEVGPARSSDHAGQPTGPRLLAGIPIGMLAAGAAVVVLAAAGVFGLIASRGPETSPSQARPQAPVPRPALPQVTTPRPTPSPTIVPTVSCRYVKTQVGSVPRSADLPRSTGVVKAGRVGVTVATSQGRLIFSLDRGRTPCTVNNFLDLAAQGFYDATPCHRLVTRGIFVLQCGDPGGTGTGGPGYSFADENLPGERSAPTNYPAGTIAMANGGPNSNGSQFFIVFKDSQLLPTWTIFGRVTAGLDVLQAVAAAGSRPAGDGKPNKPVTIASVTLA